MTVNNANISVENVFAANGIIHIIDTAIMPPSADLVVGDASVRIHFFCSPVSDVAVPYRIVLQLYWVPMDSLTFKEDYR